MKIETGMFLQENSLIIAIVYPPFYVPPGEYENANTYRDLYYLTKNLKVKKKLRLNNNESVCNNTKGVKLLPSQVVKILK